MPLARTAVDNPSPASIASTPLGYPLVALAPTIIASTAVVIPVLSVEIWIAPASVAEGAFLPISKGCLTVERQAATTTLLPCAVTFALGDRLWGKTLAAAAALKLGCSATPGTGLTVQIQATTAAHFWCSVKYGSAQCSFDAGASCDDPCGDSASFSFSGKKLAVSPLPVILPM